jgi:hypothetical protein
MSDKEKKIKKKVLVIKSECYLLLGLRFPLIPRKRRFGDFVGNDHSTIPLNHNPV